MNFFKEFINSIVVGLSVFGVFLIIAYIQGKPIIFDRDLGIDLLEDMLFSFIIYMSNAYVFRFIYCRNKKGLFKQKHLIEGITGGIIVSILAIFVARLILLVGIYGKSFEVFLGEEGPRFYLVSFIISMVVTLLFYAIFYYRYTKENQVKEQKIIAGTASAQFDALKNQLDPHFLFNSLNVLTSLIEENPDQAQKFTTSLSKVYRYVLEQKNKELISLEEELAFAKTYMNLVKMRFEDSILFTLPQVVKNPQAKIVPLSLQLLLENAVKHNSITTANKLHIEIIESGDELLVKNNLQPKAVIKKGSGVGLANIRQRYKLLSNRPMKIIKTPESFVVSLPLLTREVRQTRVSDSYLADKRYAQAKDHIEKLKGFYGHLVVYCIFVLVFIVINVWTTSFPWAIFPIIGWGLGVFFHAMEVFNWNPLLGRSWESRKIRELMDKE